MLAISAKNNKLISGGKDKIICIWDLERNSLLTILDNKLLKCGEIMAIQLHPNKDEIFFVDKIKNLKFYNLDKDSVTKISLKNKQGFYFLKISDQGNKIITCGADGELFMIDYKTKKSKKFIGHKDTVSCAVISKEEKILYSCSFDKKILIWNIKKGSIITRINNDCEIKVLCLGKISNYLFSVDDNATIKSFLLEDKESDNLNSFKKKKKEVNFFENCSLKFEKESESIKYSDKKSYQSENEYKFLANDFKSKKIQITYKKLDEIFENIDDFQVLKKIINNVNQYDNYKSIELDFKLFEKLKKTLELIDNEKDKKEILFQYYEDFERFYINTEKFLCDIFNFKLKKFANFKITKEIRNEFFDKKNLPKKNSKKTKKRKYVKNKKKEEKKIIVDKKHKDKNNKNVLKFFKKKDKISSTDSNEEKIDSDDIISENDYFKNEINFERKKKIEKKSNKYCIRKTAKRF